MQQKTAFSEKVQNKSSKMRQAATIPKSAIKLAVALQLRSEGYDEIAFDKPIDTCVGRVYIHVLAEDPLELKVAVYCINKVEEINPNRLLDIVTAIQQIIGDDGDVAIAMPINLLSKAGQIFGMTPRVFLVDYEMRVWVYTHYHSGVTRALKRDLLEMKGQEGGLDEDEGQQQETPCLDAAKACNIEYVV